MSKRTSRFARVVASLIALAVGGFCLAMLSRANAPPDRVAHQPLNADPTITGALRPVRWCGVAPWCR